MEDESEKAILIRLQTIEDTIKELKRQIESMQIELRNLKGSIRTPSY
jgi:chaperonin cofactor prefoldin